MKNAILTIVLILSVLCMQAQSLIGAWEALGDFNGKQLRSVVIFTENHQVGTFYDAKTGAFMGTNGGGWSIDGNTITEVIEFDTENSERVGSTHSFDIELSENELKIKNTPVVWRRIDNGTPGNLAGAWLISGKHRVLL